MSTVACDICPRCALCICHNMMVHTVIVAHLKEPELKLAPSPPISLYMLEFVSITPSTRASHGRSIILREHWKHMIHRAYKRQHSHEHMGTCDIQVPCKPEARRLLQAHPAFNERRSSLLKVPMQGLELCYAGCLRVGGCPDLRCRMRHGQPQLRPIFGDFNDTVHPHSCHSHSYRG
jgi:hypothetical protein